MTWRFGTGISRVMMVIVGTIALSVPAAAQQKSAKECNDEWTANKASIQASGKTKKVYVAECRGMAAVAPGATPATTPAASPAPGAASGQKSAKECNDEWKTDKASIQASGKTKKVYVAECRGLATASPTAAPPAQSSAPSTAPPPTAPAPTATSPAPRSRATRAAPESGTAAPAAGQYASEAEAKATCFGDTVVWANLNTKVYHYAGGRSYGKTKKGAYMCERSTEAAGIRAAKNEKRP
jgi:hypothetical protein